jgi:hypothetical protein
LKDLDNVDVLEPNNAFILRSLANVKMMLEDCQRPLEDLDEADVVWKIKIQNIALVSTFALGSFRYMAPKIIL